MGTQLVLSFAKRYFFNLSNALNSKHNSQTIRILSPYRNISLFSFVFILKSMFPPRWLRNIRLQTGGKNMPIALHISLFLGRNHTAILGEK